MRRDKHRVCFRIVRAARPVGRGRLAPIVRVAIGPSARLTDGGVNIGPSRYFAIAFSASARSSGVKSIRSSIGQTLAVVRPAAWSGTAASANTTRPACRPSAPAALRSARSVRRSRG